MKREREERVEKVVLFEHSFCFFEALERHFWRGVEEFQELGVGFWGWK